MTAAQREFDIVLYGATGFVGKLTAEYLARPGGAARIALAGRSAERLLARARLARRGGAGLAADRRRRRVAVDAERHGGPHPGGRHHRRAPTRSTGCRWSPRARPRAPTTPTSPARRCSSARASTRTTSRPSTPVHGSCTRADSTPSLRISPSTRCTSGRVADGAGQLGETNFVLRGFAGGVSGGTVASMIEVMRTSSADPEARRAMTDPYTLTTDRAGRTRARPPVRHPVAARSRHRPRTGRHLDGRVRDGCDELANRAAQQRVARLGVRPHVPLRGEHERRLVGRRAGGRGGGHGRQRRRARPGQPVLQQAAARAGRARRAETRHRPERTDQGERPLHGSRPTPTTSSGARYRATMAQQGDPGYKATAVLLGECGLALALDRDGLSDLRGVLTPAAAHGRRAADPVPRRGGDAGDRTAGLITVERNACRTRSSG